jgi:hypothetical protein
MGGPHLSTSNRDVCGGVELAAVARDEQPLAEKVWQRRAQQMEVFGAEDERRRRRRLAGAGSRQASSGCHQLVCFSTQRGELARRVPCVLDGFMGELSAGEVQDGALGRRETRHELEVMRGEAQRL